MMTMKQTEYRQQQTEWDVAAGRGTGTGVRRAGNGWQLGVEKRWWQADET